MHQGTWNLYDKCLQGFNLLFDHKRLQGQKDKKILKISRAFLGEITSPIQQLTTVTTATNKKSYSGSRSKKSRAY